MDDIGDQSFLEDYLIPDCQIKLPLALPNWSEASSRKKTYARLCNRFDHDVLPDYGATGVIFTDTGELVSLKNDLPAPFAPRRCALPYLTSKRCAPHSSLLLPPNNSQLSYHKRSNKLIVNRNKGLMSFFDLIEDEENATPSVLMRGDEYIIQCQNTVRNITIRENSHSLNDFMAIHCDKAVEVIQLIVDEDSEENERSFSTAGFPIIDNSKFSFMEDGCHFQYVSFNPHEGMETELLLAVSTTNDFTCPVEIACYDFDTNCVRWNVSTKSHDDDSKFVLPVALYHSEDHPRIAMYADHRAFGQVDTRIRSKDCYRTTFSALDKPTLFHWERFCGAIPVPTISFKQHFIVTDHHIVLVDDRFPQRAVMQWNHCLEISPRNPFKYIKTTPIDHVAGNSTRLVTMANSSNLCLLTLGPSGAPDVIQPKSLHRPLHVSAPDDCYNFFMEATLASDAPIEVRMNESKFNGLDVVSSSKGFSLFTLTDYRDIFVQDFYKRDDVRGESHTEGPENDTVDYSWKYLSGRTDLSLDMAAVTHLSAVFKNLSAIHFDKLPVAILKNSCNECCDAWAFQTKKASKDSDTEMKTSPAREEAAEESNSERVPEETADAIENSDDDLRDEGVLTRAARKRSRSSTQELAMQRFRTAKAEMGSRINSVREKENSAAGGDEDMEDQRQLWNDMSYKLLEDWGLESYGVDEEEDDESESS